MTTKTLGRGSCEAYLSSTLFIIAYKRTDNHWSSDASHMPLYVSSILGLNAVMD